MAPVGQAARQAVQLPQRSGWGGSGASSRSVSTSASTTQLPWASVMRQPFFPTQPRPARSAQAFSITGPMSQPAQKRASGCRAWSSDSSARSFRFIEPW